MSILKRVGLLLIAIAALALATGVGAQDANILRVATNEPQNLDPAFNPNDPETLFNRTIYDYLVELLPNNEVAPNLATGWEISEDGLTYTFTLRDGVSFHDGSAFTSADVVFTFNRLTSVGSPALSLLGEFTVAAPDAQTVVFTLTQRNADFLYGVASRWALILKDGTNAPNVLGEGDAAYASFNGTGPFVLTAYEPGVRAVFTANANYWMEGAPALAGVEMIFINDPIAQVDALRGGAADFIFKLPVDQTEVLEAAEGITPILTATSQHPVVRLRADQGPGADVRVRQAFKLATDRAALNDILLQGRGVVGNNDPISPVFGAFFNAVESEYNPEAARALLAEAGYTDGLSMTLYTPDSLGYADLATVLAGQWAEAGINVAIEVRPENVYYSTDEWLTVDLGITGWGARPTPQAVLNEAYLSSGLYNESHWADEELDALIAQAGTIADPVERAAVYAQISAIFAERGPILIPYFAPLVSAVRSNVQGLEVPPFPGLADFRAVTLGS